MRNQTFALALQGNPPSLPHHLTSEVRYDSKEIAQAVADMINLREVEEWGGKITHTIVVEVDSNNKVIANH
jgi:hypothetical protein